ncbi:MAG: hypothetical protein C4293_18870 [Nitrospiraceae bacterium]
MTKVPCEAEELRRGQIMPPDHVSVLVVLFLEFVHRLRGNGLKGRILRLDQCDNIRVGIKPGPCGNLILRNRVQEQPGEVIAVIMLIITAQIGLVALAMIMKA